MADRSKKTSADAGGDLRARRNLMIWLAIAVLLAAGLATGVILGMSALWPQWFAENPRMILRHVLVSSRGSTPDRWYWSNHRGELLRRLNLRLAVPLWQVDVGELRRKLEDPKMFSSVRNARVYAILPDTLRIEITERTPVAFVFHRGSQIVADESCMLIRRRESMAAEGQWDELPLISGLVPQATAGSRDARLAPAMALIREVRKNNEPGMKIDIREIELRYPDKMYCRFRFGMVPGEFRALFPIRHYEGKLGVQLQELKAALIDELRRGGTPRRNFDLSFERRAIIKPDGL